MRGHTKGVVGLAYVPEYKYLLSASFDHDAIVWSPLVGSMVYKLKGHATPLVGVKHVPDSPEVGSGHECEVIVRSLSPS